MKKLLGHFMFISFLVGVFLFFYNTNKDFGELIDSLFSPSTQKVKNKSIKNCEGEDCGEEYYDQEFEYLHYEEYNPYQELDEYAKNTPKEFEKDIKTLAEYLIIPTKSDLEKTRVFYTWLATHINYNDDGYNSGNYGDCSAKGVLSSKKAVCDGYASLFKSMCDAVGLEAVKISGYSKGYSYKIGDKITKTNHAWNAVKIDKIWHLYDATWGAGYGKTVYGKLESVAAFEPYWFDVKSKEFIFSHLPEQSKFQLNGPPITLEQFEQMPYTQKDLFMYGFDINELYKNAIEGTISEFVSAYKINRPIKVINVPYIKSIEKNKETTFEIESDYVSEIALVDGKDWHYFEKKGSLFSIKHQPKNSQLMVCVKSNPKDKKFQTIFAYSIVSKNL